ncbi:MAG: MBL fold metallo-hydrolase [Ruminococcaceae bacterium]|nr:MBL fold metallo-hydrolase [Oscillospiraceae bacterium]
MRITVLSENTSQTPRCSAEHGLSLYIQTEQKNILFDMGQSDLFAKNAAALGVELSDVDICILSHGHYDHGGGISKFLSLNSKAPLYLSPFAFGDYYNAADKYIGLDKALMSNPRLIHVDEESLCLGEGISLVCLNGQISTKDIESAGLTVCLGGSKQPDDFLHEQYLIIEEQGRRVVFSGCSHKGAVNIARLLKPDVFIGGFHFSKTETEGDGAARLEGAARALLSIGADFYTCHCTGVPQYEYLKSIMGDRLSYISAGTVLEI